MGIVFEIKLTLTLDLFMSVNLIPKRPSVISKYICGVLFTHSSHSAYGCTVYRNVALMAYTKINNLQVEQELDTLQVYDQPVYLRHIIVRCLP